MAAGRVETTSEIIELFEGLIKKSYDATKTLYLLNQADAQIRRERFWQSLKKVDGSKSTSSGDTYLTYHTLPDDFDGVLHRIYVGTTPFHQIPFEEYII